MAHILHFPNTDSSSGQTSCSKKAPIQLTKKHTAVFVAEAQLTPDESAKIGSNILSEVKALYQGGAIDLTTMNKVIHLIDHTIVGATPPNPDLPPAA